MKLLLGDGMLTTSDHAQWKRKRKRVDRAFRKPRLGLLTEMMSVTTMQMIERWRVYANTDAPLNVAPEMMGLALEIVVRALFSTDITHQIGTIDAAFHTANSYISRITWDPLARVRSRLPSRRRRKFNAAVKTLDDVVFKLLDERHNSDARRDDLLDMIIAHSEGEEPISDGELRDEILTLMIAGHETTANALAWTWYMLSRHPETKRRIRDEVTQVLGDRDIVTMEDYHQLGYTRRVIMETMRIYPPLWFLPRTVERTTSLKGVRVPENAMVLISPHTLHHDPRFWTNPEGFDPDRFLNKPEQYTYIPFGAGPRTCLGKNFALIEATIIVALVVRAFDLAVIPTHDIRPVPLLTLRPRRGVPVRVTEVAR